MAKRNGNNDAALNLDSLMDTVTNVVGVLMIVLIMVSLNVAMSVNKILSELPPVTQEELDKLKEEVEQLKTPQDPKKLEEELAKKKENLKKTNDELKTLDTTSDQQKASIDLAELQAKLEKHTKERNERKTIVDNMINELEKLKARLDTMPVYVPPPATVVKLPNPRPIPQNAVYHRFYVIGDRVVYLNDAEFMRVVSEGIEKQKKSLIYPNPIKNAFGEVIMAGGKPKEFLDRKKVEAFFADRLRLSTKDLKVELAGNQNSSRLNLKLTLQPNGGESLTDIKNPGSVFQRAMRKFASEPNTVVWFHVYKDAIGTYLAARDIADEAKVACGWELTNNEFYQKQIQTFEVDFVPPKPQPPPPPGTIQIAPPKATLD